MVALASVFAAGVANAQTAPSTSPKAAANPQQERMKACNDKAKGMKGDERKEYMSACLAGKEPEKKLTAQQQKMKDCGAKWQAYKKEKNVKGRAEYRKFQSTCLKG